jgi:glycosyltransferase involved in cell wall biosynthesis
MVLLEAMACGLPLLVANSNTSAAPYIVEGNGMLFIPNDFQDLAAKTIRMLSDKEKLLQMKKRSLELVRGYDIEKSIDKLETVFYKMKEEYEKTAS